MSDSSGTGGYQESRWRRAWHELPAEVRWLLGGLCVLALTAAFQVASERLVEEGSSSRELYVAAGCVVLVAAGVAAGLLQSRRRLGGKGQLALLRRALREGRVPAAADRRSWARELQRRQRYLRESRWIPWVALVGSALFVVLAVLAAVAIVIMEGPLLAALFFFVPPLLLAGTGVGCLRLHRLRERRVQVLVDELADERTGRGRD